MSDQARIDIEIDITLNGLQSFSQVMQNAERMRGQMDRVSSSLKGQQTRWDKLHQALSDIEQRYDAVFRAGFRVAQAGHDLKNIGDEILGFLGNATDQWGDYEFMLNRAAGAMDLFDNKAPLYKQLSDGVQAVAREVRIFPAQDVAKALYFWASTTGQTIKSQKDLQVVMKQLTPILKTAALTETDYETAVKTAYNVTEQFGLGIGSAGEVTEKMLIITQRTAAEFGDLAGSLKYVGPVAAQMKVPFDEVVKTLGLVADRGIRSTQAGRALRQMFIQTLRPSAKAKEAYNDVFAATLHVQNGFDKLIFPDGKYIGLTKHVRLLAQVTKNMTDAEKGHFLATISTANELPVLTAMVEAETESLKKGKDAIDDQKYSLVGYQETFEKMFGLLGNSWKGLVGLLRNSVQPIILRIGAAAAEMATPWIESLSKIVQGIDDWMKRNPQLVDFAVKLAAIVGVFFAVAGSILIVIGSLLAFYGGIVVSVLAVEKFMTIMKPFVSGWLLILGAIIAVTAIIIENADVMKGHATRIIQNFRKVLQNLGLTFHGTGSIIAGFAKIIHDQLTVYILRASRALEDFSAWLVEVSKRKDVQTVVRSFVTVLGKMITLAVGLRGVMFGLAGIYGSALLLAGATLVVGRFLLAFSGIPRVVALLKMLWGGLMLLYAHPVIAGLMLLATVTAGVFLALHNNVGGVTDKIKDFLKTNAVFKKIGDTVKSMGSVITGVLAPIQKLIGDNLPFVIGYFTNLWIDLRKKVVDSVKQIWSSVSSVFGHIVSVITDTVIPVLRDHLGSIWDSLVKIIGFALSLIGGMVSFFVQQVANEFSFFAHVIVPIAEQAIHGLLAVFQVVFPIIVNVVDGTLKVIVGLIDIFKGVLTLNWGRAWQGAGEVVNGFITSLGGLFPPLAALAGILTAIAVKNAVQFAFSLAVTAVNAARQLIVQIGFVITKLILMGVTMAVNAFNSAAALAGQLVLLAIKIGLVTAVLAANIAKAIIFAATNYATIIPSLIAVANAAVVGAIKWAAYWIAALGPVGIAIAAIAGLAAAWITDFMGIREALEDVNDATQKWLDTVPLIKNVREALFGLKGSADDIKYLEDAFQSSGITIQDGAARMNKAADDLGISYEEMSHKVALQMENTGNDFNKTMRLIEATIPEHSKNLKDGGTQIGTSVLDGFKQGMGSLPEGLGGILSQVPGVFDSNTPSLQSAADSYANVIPTSIAAADDRALTDIKQTYSEVYNTIDTSKDRVKGVMDHFDEVLKQPKRTTKQAVGDMIADLKKLAPALDGSLGVDAKAAAQSGSEEILKVLKSLDEDAYKKYLHTAKGLPDAFKNEKANVEAEITDTRNKVIDKMQDLVQNQKLNSLEAARLFPDALNKGVNTVDVAADTYLRGARNKFRDFQNSASGWAAGAAQAYANTWPSWGTVLKNKIADYLQYGTKILRTASPPKEGPFHLIDKWAEGAAQVYADSFAGQKPYLKSSVSDFLSAASMEMNSQGNGVSANFGFETTDQRELLIKVDVTSSDGSVTPENAQSIADAIHKGLMLDRLEHMGAR